MSPRQEGKVGEQQMVADETEKPVEVMEKQIGLIQTGIRYGLGIAFVGALLCIVVMLPVFVMFGTSLGESTRELSLPILLVVSVAVPLAGIGVVGAGLYRVIPLYIRYRYSKRPPEDLFP